MCCDLFELNCKHSSLVETAFCTLCTQFVLVCFDAPFKIGAVCVQMKDLPLRSCVHSVWYASLNCHRCEIPLPPAPHDKTEVHNSPEGKKQQTCKVPANLIPELSSSELKARNHARCTNGKSKLHLGKLSWKGLWLSVFSKGSHIQFDSRSKRSGFTGFSKYNIVYIEARYYGNVCNCIGPDSKSHLPIPTPKSLLIPTLPRKIRGSVLDASLEPEDPSPGNVTYATGSCKTSSKYSSRSCHG